MRTHGLAVIFNVYILQVRMSHNDINDLSWTCTYQRVDTISSCYASCKHQNTKQDFRSMLPRLHGRCGVICELEFAERTCHRLTARLCQVFPGKHH